jgi:type I pantothenate kinase
MDSLRDEISPYRHFERNAWAKLRADTPMTLDQADIDELRGLNDRIDLAEVVAIYLPLSRLLNLYVAATQELFRATDRFLHAEGTKVPYVIGMAGSVAVGKSTTARILQRLLARWPNHPKVDLVTTDGFLFSNAELEKRGIMDRKGFPESYDRTRFITFLSDIKSGRPRVGVPVYSHLHYDLMPGEETVVESPDILIVEGLNILQPGELPRSGKPIVFASDFIDFSIYIDADEKDLETWFMERFARLRTTAFADPRSFFHKFSQMSEKEATDFGLWAWTAINLPNLRDNILPTRSRADLILRKGVSHAIEEVRLRKL